MQYICEICGWIYDEDMGDKSLDIGPGTKFDELSQDFKCPVCNAGVEAFTGEDE